MSRGRFEPAAIAALAAAVALGACSEPDKRITRSTVDGLFSLTLDAQKNWARPGESLPIQVKVESLAGRLTETSTDSVVFIVNNGTVTPNSLTFSFIGTADESAQVTGTTADSRFSLTLSAEKKWVRPGEDLLVHLRVESLTGRLAETLEESVQLTAMHGTVDSEQVFATFVGVDDSVSSGVETVYEDRITFSASRVVAEGRNETTVFSTAQDVGEIHAFLQDLQLTLKLRTAEGEAVMETQYETWVTYTAPSRATAMEQGQIHALLQDLQSTLNIRFVEESE